MEFSSFTSVDWGTSNVRLRRVVDGRVSSVAASDSGASRLSGPAEFEAELGRLMREAGAEPPVVMSGMVGSSIGWKEVPYARLPFALDGTGANLAEVADGIWIIGGVRSENDVMRGEETELLGLVNLPADICVVLPGTHSKHCQIHNGILVDFRTFLTGELFGLIREHSVLRTCLDGDSDGEGFEEGVLEGANSPLLASIFGVRSRSLLGTLAKADSLAYLSGILIGAELAALASEVPLRVAGSPAVVARYLRAGRVLGFGDRFVGGCETGGEPSAVAGQIKILQRLSGL